MFNASRFNSIIFNGVDVISQSIDVSMTQISIENNIPIVSGISNVSISNSPTFSLFAFPPTISGSSEISSPSLVIACVSNTPILSTVVNVQSINKNIQINSFVPIVSAIKTVNINITDSLNVNINTVSPIIHTENNINLSVPVINITIGNTSPQLSTNINLNVPYLNIQMLTFSPIVVASKNVEIVLLNPQIIQINSFAPIVKYSGLGYNCIIDSNNRELSIGRQFRNIGIEKLDLGIKIGIENRTIDIDENSRIVSISKGG